MKHHLALAACLLVPGGFAAAAELSDATVSQILGIANLSHTSKATARKNGSALISTYKDPAGQMVVTIMVGTAQQFDDQKPILGDAIQPEPDLGVEAVSYKGTPMLSAKSATTSSHVTPYRKTITKEQVRALVKAAL